MKSKVKIAIASLVLLSILFFLIKFASVQLINNLYSNKNFHILNKLANCMTDRSLDYYQGVIEERITGPASSVISGVAFIIFSLTFLLDASVGKMTFYIFLFLIITKIEILFFPPWGDHVGGSLSEAIWLKRNNFNYIGLSQQQSSIFGGPKFFLFSIYPGFIALMMKIFTNAKAFLFTSHLITFGMSSLIAGLFYKFTNKILENKTAILSTILLIALPLFQSMTEMINMEIPCLFFSILCINYLCGKKFWRATLMAILAILIKGPGSIACGAVFFTCFLFFIFPDKSVKNKPLFRLKMILLCAISIAAAFGQVYLRAKFVHVVNAHHNEVRPFVGVPNLIGLKFIQLYYGISLLGLLIYFIKTKIISKTKGNFATDNIILFVFYLFTTLWFCLHINISVMGPRYKLIFTPTLLLCFIFALQTILHHKKTVNVLIGIAVLGAYLGSYGLYYPNRIQSKYYAYNWLERSLEYRNDMKLHQKIAKEIETNFSDFTIGSPHVTAQMIAFPEFGYSKKQPDMFMYGMSITYGGIHNFPGLNNLNLYKTLWIGFLNDSDKEFDYPIDPNDKIVKVIEVGDKKTTLFMGGFAIQKFYNIVMMNQIKRQMMHGK